MSFNFQVRSINLFFYRVQRKSKLTIPILHISVRCLKSGEKDVDIISTEIKRKVPEDFNNSQD